MAALELPDFVANRPAREAHRALLAADRAADQARHCAVLWFGEILQRRLYRELGYGSMPQYAKAALGFSASKTTDFMTLARRLETLPAVRASLAAGEIGYTKAREVVKVASARTDAKWAEAARTRSRQELARRVRAVQAKAKRRKSGQLELGAARPAVAAADLENLAREVPVRVGLAFTPEQHARWEAAWERLRMLGGVPSDRAEALLDALDALAGTSEAPTSSAETACPPSAPRGARRPPVQIHAHLCPRCERMEVDGRPVARADAARLRCDAAVAAPGGRNTTTIPPRVRREVLARDRHACQAPGCGRRRYLEVHHVVPRNRGGSNAAGNLVTLCAACHRVMHEGAGERSLPARPTSPTPPPAAGTAARRTSPGTAASRPGRGR